MPKRSSKPPEDENVAAFEAIAGLTGQSMEAGKNPAAVYLGRLGGKKGGPARAQKLSAIQRRRIARKAAKVRWAEHNKRQSRD